MLENRTKQYIEGVHAYLNGLSINDNPNTLGASRSNFSEWSDGFFDAEEIAHDAFDINEETKAYIESLSLPKKEEEPKSPFHWIYK